MADELKEGDVVTLKSEGPPMTVNYIQGNDDVQCVFFNGNQQEWLTVQKAALKKIE